MNAHQLRGEARAKLELIKSDPEMQNSIAAMHFCNALVAMIGIHNASVEPEARLYGVRIPEIGPNQILLLRQAFNGDVMPLIQWLSPRVDWDPSWICGVLP